MFVLAEVDSFFFGGGARTGDNLFLQENPDMVCIPWDLAERAIEIYTLKKWCFGLRTKESNLELLKNHRKSNP